MREYTEAVADHLNQLAGDDGMPTGADLEPIIQAERQHIPHNTRHIMETIYIRIHKVSHLNQKLPCRRN